jgi:hypothetical protein
MRASTDRPPARDDHPAMPRRGRWVIALRVVLGTTGALAGAAWTSAIAVVGHCAAFGGRCPSPPPPLLEDDVFVGLVVGLSVAVASVVLALRPDRRGARLVAVLVPLGVLPAAYAIAVVSHRGSF